MRSQTSKYSGPDIHLLIVYFPLQHCLPLPALLPVATKIESNCDCALKGRSGPSTVDVSPKLQRRNSVARLEERLYEQNETTGPFIFQELIPRGIRLSRLSHLGLRV